MGECATLTFKLIVVEFIYYVFPGVLLSSV